MDEKKYTKTVDDAMLLFGFSRSILCGWLRNEVIDGIKVKNKWWIDEKSLLDTKELYDKLHGK